MLDKLLDIWMYTRIFSKLNMTQFLENVWFFLDNWYLLTVFGQTSWNEGNGLSYSH